MGVVGLASWGGGRFNRLRAGGRCVGWQADLANYRTTRGSWGIRTRRGRLGGLNSGDRGKGLYLGWSGWAELNCLGAGLSWIRG